MFKTLLLLSIPFFMFANNHHSCNVKQQYNFPNIKEGSIKLSVIGTPCYKAQYKMEIVSGNKVLYSYQARFKPHIAVHWKDTSVFDAESFLKDEMDQWRFKKCNKLPEIIEDGDLPYYGKLLISEKKYLNYKKSNCSIYIHTYRDYEGNRVIIFPKEENKAILAR